MANTGLYFGLFRTIIFPRILSCLGFLSPTRREGLCPVCPMFPSSSDMCVRTPPPSQVLGGGIPGPDKLGRSVGISPHSSWHLLDHSFFTKLDPLLTSTALVWYLVHMMIPSIPRDSFRQCYSIWDGIITITIKPGSPKGIPEETAILP